jgi:uncharacterized repeat protein (TIGR01451 family)
MIVAKFFRAVSRREERDGEAVRVIWRWRRKVMVMKRMAGWGVLLTLLAPLVALAKPEIQLEMQAQKEIVVEEDGKAVTKRVKAETIETGEIVIYTLSYRNSGDEAAHNVVVDNPIPEGTVYLLDSAYGENADITFSIDGGNSYKKPSLLTYRANKADGSTDILQATPDIYTNIRWVIQSIDSRSQGHVGFQVTVK